MPTPVKTPREGPNILCAELLHDFLKLQPEVFRRIRSKVRTHPNRQADAEDILQRAIVKALRRAETFQRDKDLSRWFFTIAYNSIIDEHRTGRPERRFYWLESSAIEEIVAHNSPSPEEIIIEKDIREKRMRALRALIQKLPPQMGVMVRLRCDGYSDEEIAREKGVSKSTVRVNIYRGIEKAKKIIRELRAA